MSFTLTESPLVKNKNLPNFFVIGAEKAGTTALYQYLKQHPQIYLPYVKEPMFFATERKQRRIVTWDAYEEIYKDINEEIAIGDMSPQYIQSPSAPYGIKKHIPSAKIIALLRHPVDRAYSHYMMLINSNTDIPYRDFSAVFREKCLELDQWHKADYKSYGLRLSFYFENIKRYFDSFDKCNIKIILYEEFLADPNSILQEICQFLTVDQSYEFQDIGKANLGNGIPKNKTIHSLIMRSNPIKSAAKLVTPLPLRKIVSNAALKAIKTPKSELTTEVRRNFLQIYMEDIKKLESLINRDLSIWYS